MLAFYYSVLIVNIIYCIFLLKFDLQRYSPSAIFWLTILSIFLIPAIADPFVEDVQAHPLAVSFILNITTLAEAQVFVFLFLSLIFFSYLLLVKNNKTKRLFFAGDYFCNQKLNPDCKGFHKLIMFLLLSIYAVVEAYNQFGSSLFTHFDFTAKREEQSFFSTFLLSYNLIICAGVFFWLISQRKYIISLLFGIVYFLLFFVMGGSRQPIIVLFLPFFLYFLFKSKRGLLYSLLFAVLFQIISKILEYLLYLRNLPGMGARIDSLFHFYDFIFFNSEKLGSSESDLRFAYYYFVQNSTSIQGFNEFSYFKRLLFFWLPSFWDFFNIKPDDFEYVMYYEYMLGKVGSMHPTFFGSIYADGGWFIVPWLIYSASLLLLTVPILKLYRGWAFFAIWGLFSYVYMMMARGSLYGPFVILSFGLVFVWLAQNFSSRLFFKWCLK